MTKQYDSEGHEMYHTYEVGKAWGDPLLKTSTPEGTIYERGKTGPVAAFPKQPSFVAREEKRCDALEEVGCGL